MNRDALVVGINTYQSPSLINLQAPAADAEAMATVLEKQGDFNVWRLPEAVNKVDNSLYVGKKTAVNFTQLENAIINLFKPEGNNIPDTSLLYFSGHGIRKTSGLQEGFLATSDVNPKIGFNGLSLQWLRRLLQESPVKQQIIWLDCCHSGELLNFNEADPGEQGFARDRCFIAASREFEVAYEDLGDIYSVLTKVLLKGLDPQRSPTQWITNYSLVEYINQNLVEATQRPIYSNFGSPINLTHTWEVAPLSNGNDERKKESLNEICPYKGLQYFDCNDEDPKYFYGREDLTDLLIDHVREHNFLAIVGASGSGKSSVLRAGLLHQLKLGQKLSGSHLWKVLIMVPGEQPLSNLGQLFVDPLASQLDRAEQLGKAEGLLKEGAEGLRRLVQCSDAPRVLLVIDQFEEMFTLCSDKIQREKFFECILGALQALQETDAQLCVILTMRADFFGKCVEQEYSGLATKIQENLIAVTPMNREQLESAIILPAQRVKLQVEPELIEQMFRDIEGSPGSLPLLQYTLTQLWQKKSNNSLQLVTYSQLGGIGGTLNQRATKVFEELEDIEKEAAKHIFLCLTRLGEGTEDTRRRVRQQELVNSKYPEPLVNKVVQILANEKLIVTSEMIAKDSTASRLAVVEVAHEALIRHWQQLKQWLNENRESLLQQRRIEIAATDWQNNNYKPDYFLTGRRLGSARNFQKEQGEQFPLSESAELFITKSLKHQRINLIKGLGIFLLIPLVGTAIGGYFVVREIQLNSDKQLIAQSQCLEKEYCHGRIEALERLVRANRSLKSYNLRNANLQSANLGGANLKSAYLFDANLESANLESANLEFAYLEFANLESANLESANLEFAYLFDANLSSANLEFANLRNAKLYNANLRDANLEFANLVRANLYSADLQFANLVRANLRDAYLVRANLRDAYLVRANLVRANLVRADLQFANLEGAYLFDANLIDVKNLTHSQIKSSCNWQQAYYKGSWDDEKGEWIIDEEANQEFIKTVTADKASNPKEPPDCSKWQR